MCGTLEKMRNSSLELEFKEERDERRLKSRALSSMELNAVLRNLDVIVSINSGTHRKV